jgi:hypothetical protein
MKWQIGDRVLVSRDNWAWPCTIIGIRSGSEPRYEVRTDDDETFWAFDYEIDDLPEPGS